MKILNLFVVFTLAVLTGCGNPNRAPRPQQQQAARVEVPATPPKLGDVAYRPEFHFNNGQAPASAGTAFVVKSATGDRYLLTAAHLLDTKEWKSVQSVKLKDFRGGKTLGQSVGAPIYIGRGMDPARDETEFDLAVFKLAPGDSTTPLKLAATYPNQNRLWAVGCEVTSRDGVQRVFELKPNMAANKSIVLDKINRFNVQAFSGGPLVDHNGVVVGSLLGANETTVIGTSVDALRQRLTEKGIIVD